MKVIDYKHYDKAFDYDPRIEKVNSTDIVNISISKNLFNNYNFAFMIQNLLDEGYQRPVGSFQDGQLFKIRVKSVY